MCCLDSVNWSVGNKKTHADLCQVGLDSRYWMNPNSVEEPPCAGRTRPAHSHATSERGGAPPVVSDDEYACHWTS